MVHSSYLLISIVAGLSPYVLGSPIASPEPAPVPVLTENITGNNAYTGTGGNAVGGSVVASADTTPGLLDLITDKSVLSLFSENAGKGGDASSGTAAANGLLGGAGRTGGLTRVTGGRGASKLVSGGKKAGLVAGLLPSLPLAGLGDATVNSNVGNAYSGTGGAAAGGNVSTPGSLLDLFSRESASPSLFSRVF